MTLIIYHSFNILCIIFTEHERYSKEYFSRVCAQKPLMSRHNGGSGGDGSKAQPCQIHLTQSRSNCCSSWLSKFPTRSKRIDVISRIFFPMVFAFFNLAYWSTYLFTDEEDHLPKSK